MFICLLQTLLINSLGHMSERMNLDTAAVLQDKELYSCIVIVTLFDLIPLCARDNVAT